MNTRMNVLPLRLVSLGIRIEASQLHRHDHPLTMIVS